MCGIVGYVGREQVTPFLLKGLERLEYRGYDSAGLAVVQDGTIRIYKKKGRVAALKDLIADEDMHGTLGIAHTRWATHGEPNNTNAHPHASNDGKIVLVHNGIIENYLSVKCLLESRGYVFHSETDTEVIANLIQETRKTSTSTLEAIQAALVELVGAYGLSVISEDDPGTLFVARNGSPIVIGLGKGEFFVASDATPIVEHTRDVVYLNDGDVAVLRQEGTYEIVSIHNEKRTPVVQKLELDIETLEKGNFEHFMLKEIFEQPKTVADSLRGRLNVKEGMVTLGGIQAYENTILSAKRIIFVACGTSWHAALTGEYFIETLARIPVEVEYASEFRYRNPVITKEDVVIAISQSGETADTLAAMQLAKASGATVLGICNVVGSSIARFSDAGIYTHAGSEIGVASTKAFTAQLSVLLLMALRFGHLRKVLSEDRLKHLVLELSQVPKHIEQVLGEKDSIFSLAASFVEAKDVFYLGRGLGFPTALEGALKLKEISYLHAEGYPAGEMKHGPIALIEKGTPTMFIATKSETLEKVVSNMQEIKARGGWLVAIATQGESSVTTVADVVIQIPEVDELIVPFLASIPLQLLAYQVAVLRGCDVDKPRNLAKSVTVE